MQDYREYTEMIETTALQADLADPEGFEASPQQARLWPLLQALPAAGRRSSVQVQLPAASEVQRLQHALLTVVERHEILRTRLRTVGALTQPLQFIDAQASVDWNPRAAGRSALAVFLQEAPQAITLTLEADAALLDGGSLLELVDQWATAFRAGKTGQSAQPEMPLQYADYAAWRSERIADEGAGRLFWSERLRAAAVTRLPLRPAGISAEFRPANARHALTVDDELRAAIEALSRRSGHTTALVLLAAWVALLYRHIGSDTVSLAVEWPSPQAELACALGVFVEPLPVLAQNLGDSGFDALCRQLAADLAVLDEYRDSFPSTAAAPPILGFRYLAAPAGGDRQALAWSLQSLALPAAAGLHLSVLAVQGGIGLELAYADSVYSEQAIASLGSQLRALILSATLQAPTALTRLSLSGPDGAALLDNWSNADPLTPEQAQHYAAVAGLRHLGQCLETAVHRHARAAAVADKQGEISYADLHRQSTWLALHLLDQGLQPGQAVAHCLPRDRRAVIALLAILKAGAVYVPVDPHYPPARIAHILQDSQAGWLLSTEHALPELSPAVRAPLNLVLLDGLGESDAHAGLPWEAGLPEHTAYLIYTSGSTGQPKGVPISHTAALHSLAARLAYYPEVLQRYLLLSSFAFDSSIAGLFWSLAQGACLHIADAEQQKDAQAISHLLSQDPISHVLALPSLHGLLLDQMAVAPAALKAVIVAGERCSTALVRRHQQQLPGCALYNEYGPTEAAVWSSVQRCDTLKVDQEPGGIPIGRPIPGARIWVVDEQLHALPAGLQGEICIAGPGLSSGYLHQAHLTQEKFVQLPALGGARVYRTGDFGYFDEYGRLCFQGRQDGQLKIRGHRVELGEIEQALNNALLPLRAPSVVLAEETQQGLRLRAFVASAQPIDSASVLAELGKILPDHMLPAELQVLPEFPLTANGKIDGKALLARERTSERPAWRAPPAGIGQVLAALWEELLQVADIGLDDDFFALGGHSLLVAQLVYRVQQVLGRAVPVATVFQYPRLDDLLMQLAQGTQAALVPLRAGQGDVQLICCDPGDALHYYLPLVRPLPAHIHVQGLVLPVADTANTTTLTELAQAYAQEISRQALPGPLYLCGWSMGGLLALETARQLELLASEVAGVVLLDTTFRAHDESLAFDALLAQVRQELTPECQRQLDALEQPALEALQRAVAGRGKIEQLRHALLQWRPEQGLRAKAPEAVIERELRSMQRARSWIAGHAIRAPQAAVLGFWAERTLLREHELPQEWQQRHLPGLAWQVLPGDHESLLTSAILQQQLAALLATASH